VMEGEKGKVSTENNKDCGKKLERESNGGGETVATRSQEAPGEKWTSFFMKGNKKIRGGRERKEIRNN